MQAAPDAARPAHLEIHHAALTALAPQTLYRILALRSAVFVVEQRCVFLDPDGADLDGDALHLWVERCGEVVAAARLLRRGDGDVLGRVAVAPPVRGRGVGGALVATGLRLARPPLLIAAQSRLVSWYRARGFEVCGAEYVEDGIPHRPMRAG